MLIGASREQRRRRKEDTVDSGCPAPSIELRTAAITPRSMAGRFSFFPFESSTTLSFARIPVDTSLITLMTSDEEFVDLQVGCSLYDREVT